MSTITVTRDKEGKLVGAGEKDTKAYSRFRQMIVDLEPGDLFTLDYWLPRNPLLRLPAGADWPHGRRAEIYRR